jgi:phage terminase small subunit
MKTLDRKHDIFASEYVVDLDATRAATVAGYSPATASTAGPRLLAREDVARRIQRLHSDKLSRVQLRAEHVLEELKLLAFADVRLLFDEHDRLLPISQLSDEAAATIAHVQMAHGRVVGVKTWSKSSALETLVKHLGLLAPERHIHAHVSFTPEELASLSDADLERVEGASKTLVAVRQNLKLKKSND